MISYNDLESDLVLSTHNEIGKISDLKLVINRALRILNRKTDIRGTEKDAALVGGTLEYEYSCPSDIKDDTAVINILDSDKQSFDADFVVLTSYDEFIYQVNVGTGIGSFLYIGNVDGVKRLFIYSDEITPAYIRYYSNEIVLDSDGTTYKTKIETTDDRIVADDVYYEPILTLSELLLDRFNREMSTGDLKFDQAMNLDAIKDLWERYPSERLQIIECTY